MKFYLAIITIKQPGLGTAEFWKRMSETEISVQIRSEGDTVVIGQIASDWHGHTFNLVVEETSARFAPPEWNKSDRILVLAPHEVQPAGSALSQLPEELANAGFTRV